MIGFIKLILIEMMHSVYFYLYIRIMVHQLAQFHYLNEKMVLTWFDYHLLKHHVHINKFHFFLFEDVEY